jgi:CheY-like chemotaxis protein/anti-sigma regulatory factor (Ser/Thr protein kinase)
MSAAPQPQPKRVLIIDDDPAVVELLRAALQRKHIESASSTTGAEALSVLRSTRFEVILLDLGLPDVYGLELIRQLRELAPGARIVIITADATSETLLHAMREQAFEYIRKPFDIHEIVDVVERASSAVDEPAIEVHSAKPEWIELSIPCTHGAVDRIDHFIRQLIPSMPEDVSMQITQAFRELVLNAVEWGGGLDPTHRVRVCCVHTSRMLLYRIADPGPGFNFDGLNHSAAANPDGAFAMTECREEKGLRPGGFGIRLVQEIADELIYNEKQNEVILIKYLEPKPE